MDRDRIQRRDFPTSRRGYDIAAVDAHLRELADSFESHTPPPAAPMSSATSEQVRHILQAAEESVADLQARASDEASAHVSRVQSRRRRADGQARRARGRAGDAAARAARERRAPAGRARRAAGRGRRGESPRTPVEDSDLSALEEDFAPAAPADEAGARLIALNMALDGKPREETARYLTEHFALADVEALLDDVYSRAGR